MKIHMIELGPVTYEIQRAFGGEQPAAALIRDRLTKQSPNITSVAKPVDGKTASVVK